MAHRSAAAPDGGAVRARLTTRCQTPPRPPWGSGTHPSPSRPTAVTVIRGEQGVGPIIGVKHRPRDAGIPTRRRCRALQIAAPPNPPSVARYPGHVDPDRHRVVGRERCRRPAVPADPPAVLVDVGVDTARRRLLADT